MTGKEITYTILDFLTRFNYTDDSRFDPDSINFLRDNVRVQMIKQEFDRTKTVDPVWMQDLGFVLTTPVNFNDDTSIPYCECILSKVTLPSNIDLRSPNTNVDSSMKIISSCGTRQFYPYSLELLQYVPKEHTRNKFYYYVPVGSAVYLNKQVDKVRVLGVFEKPSEINDIQTEYVMSGDLVVGTSYTVKKAQIVHNSLGYNVGQTFTAVATTYTGNGYVVPTSRTKAYTEDSPYPISGDMARQLILDILVKEFQIEETKITDIKNSSTDDEQERKKAITP